MVINTAPKVNYAQQCHSIHNHLLMNMKLIFHLAEDDRESSFGKEKLNIFNEAFHVDKSKYFLVRQGKIGIKKKNC